MNTKNIASVVVALLVGVAIGWGAANLFGAASSGGGAAAPSGAPGASASSLAQSQVQASSLVQESSASSAASGASSAADASYASSASTPASGSSSADTSASSSASSAGASTSSSASSSSASSAASGAAQAGSAQTSTVVEDGTYTSKDEVAAYIHLYGHLPSNYISKTKARKAGWVASEGNLDDVLPGMSIGGSEFYNDEGQLPDAPGRTWTECDINYEGGYRGAERIVFSSDGLVFYTGDHYDTFEQLY